MSATDCTTLAGGADPGRRAAIAWTTGAGAALGGCRWARSSPNANRPRRLGDMPPASKLWQSKTPSPCCPVLGAQHPRFVRQDAVALRADTGHRSEHRAVEHAPAARARSGARADRTGGPAGPHDEPQTYEAGGSAASPARPLSCARCPTETRSAASPRPRTRPQAMPKASEASTPAPTAPAARPMRGAAGQRAAGQRDRSRGTATAARRRTGGRPPRRRRGLRGLRGAARVRGGASTGTMPGLRTVSRIRVDGRPWNGARE